VKTFEFVKIVSGTKINIYSVVLDNSGINEFEKFLTEFSDNYIEDINNIISKIDIIANVTGAREEFFKYERQASVFRFLNKVKNKKAKGKKYRESKTRLYCIKVGESILIIGGGGIKEDNIEKFQEDTRLNEIVSNMETIDKYLLKNEIDIIKAVDSAQSFML